MATWTDVRDLTQAHSDAKVRVDTLYADTALSVYPTGTGITSYLSLIPQVFTVPLTISQTPTTIWSTQPTVNATITLFGPFVEIWIPYTLQTASNSGNSVINLVFTYPTQIKPQASTFRQTQSVADYNAGTIIWAGMFTLVFGTTQATISIGGDSATAAPTPITANAGSIFGWTTDLKIIYTLL